MALGVRRRTPDGTPGVAEYSSGSGESLNGPGQTGPDELGSWRATATARDKVKGLHSSQCR